MTASKAVAAGGGKVDAARAGVGEAGDGDAGWGTAVLAGAGWAVGAGVAGDEHAVTMVRMAINAKNLRLKSSAFIIRLAANRKHLGYRQSPIRRR
jgi:hypothetical protein